MKTNCHNNVRAKITNSPILFVSVVSSDKLGDEGKQHDAQICVRGRGINNTTSKLLSQLHQWQELKKMSFLNISSPKLYSTYRRVQAEQWGVLSAEGERKWMKKKEGTAAALLSLSLPLSFLFLRPTGCLLSLVNDSAWVWMFDWTSVGVRMCVWAWLVFVCVCVHFKAHQGEGAR